MKKIFIFSLVALCVSAMFSCSSCNKKSDDKVDSKLEVEKVLSTDREYMLTNYGGEYKWYETTVVSKNFLDEETDGTIESITSVYQVVSEKDKGADTKVVFITHDTNNMNVDVKDGFWVEDFDLNKDIIKVTYKQAFDKMMAANYEKPHSRYCVIRKQVGTKEANAQYIFGNRQSQLYVDAVTCDVSDKNPSIE
jgi:hypothetical protein